MNAPVLSRSARAVLAMTQADIDRFWAKVDKTPGQGPGGKCWCWTARCGTWGYGQFWPTREIPEGAHRVAWMLTYGPIPDETPCVLHGCDNPPCCNPDCLFAGTHADNTRDKCLKGRHRHSHLYQFVETGASDGRVCAYCEAPLIRGRHACGRNESVSSFSRRRYCGSRCMGLHRRGKPHQSWGSLLAGVPAAVEGGVAL